MYPRSITVQLRSGQAAATWENRLFTPGKTYVMDSADFLRLSLSALSDQIEVVSASDAPTVEAGVDLTTNTASIPSGLVAGQVVDGAAAGERFVLVKSADALASGNSVYWAAGARGTNVTTDEVGNLEFAGVAVATVTAGNYGWILVDGYADAIRSSVAFVAGDLLTPDAANNGLVKVAGPTDPVVAVALEASVNRTTHEDGTAAVISSRGQQVPFTLTKKRINTY